MKNIFIIVGSLFISNIYAQDVAFKAGNFKDKKDAFKSALAHFEKGDDFLELGNESIYTVKSPGNNFKAAIQEYEYAFKFNHFLRGISNFEKFFRNSFSCFIFCSQRKQARD